MDPETGILPTEGTFILRRNVEMLQWVESRDKNGQENDAGAYSYSLQWRAETVLSKTFHDGTKMNPVFPIASSVIVPSGGVLLFPHGRGSKLSLSLKGSFLKTFLAASRELVHFPVDRLADGFDNAVKGDSQGDNILHGGKGSRLGGGLKGRKKFKRSDLKLGQDGVLRTGDGTKPGDLRITYDIADANAKVSIIGGILDEKGTLGYFELPSEASFFH